MIARAELSNAQTPQGEKSAATGMNVALIGPNDTHRQIVARALSSSQGRKVHEFIDYPDTLQDLSKILEQNFDFVLVDVDTDESYALQIIEKFAEIGQSVMAYSARTDQELLMACMRAGARDFLPLPTENGAPASSPEQSQMAARPAAAPTPPPVAVRPVEPKPAPAPPARFNVTPIITEKPVVAPAAETRPMRFAEEQADPEIARVIEQVTISAPAESSSAENAPSEFAEWDAANLRPPAPLPTPARRTEARPRPALVPERRKTEAIPRVVPSLETPAVPAIERPPVAVELFRSSTLQTEVESDEAAEKQGANWIRWILIAAGPVVLALVLLVVFMRPTTFHPTANAVPVKETTPAPVPMPEQTVAVPIATAVAKPAAGTTAALGTTAAPGNKVVPGAANEPDAEVSAPVSPDAMAAQLVAPTRIDGQIKKAAPAEEPPPTAPPAVSMEENSSVPGSVFGGASKVKAEPRVVAISAGVADGMILHRTPPVYPKFAQDAHITGKVVIKATINKQGTLEGIQVLSGPKILAPSAVEAVKSWKYRPYLLDGQPVSVETSITIMFGTAGK